MLKRFRHILLLAIMLSSAFQALAQVALADKVCVGTARRYSVTGTPGSTFTWKINGVIQSSVTDVLNMTWQTAGSYTLEVQEHDLNNCTGDIKSGVVTVIDLPASPVSTGDLLVWAQSPVQMLDANTQIVPETGVNIVWYEASSGGTAIVSPTLMQVGTKTYYAESNNGFCTNPARTPVKLTILPAHIVPTVNPLTTNDTTPILTGTATVGLGETLTVTVNGVTYTSGDGNLTLTGTNWSLQVPAGNEILDGVYPVTAILTDAAGNSSTDLTTGELTVSTNKAPVAVNDVFATSGPAISGALTVNDSDPEGGQLIYKTIPATTPSKGDVVIRADGTFTYTPKTTASGTDEFIYEVCDDGSPVKCSQAKVVINFNNRVPLAVNDNYLGVQGEVMNFRMSSNDSDPDGNALVYSVTPVIQPAHGTVIINSDGTFDYTPEASYTGFDSFTYEVCDNGIPVQCSRAIVSLELTKIIPVNHAPLAVNDINNTLSNMAVSGNVLTNDSDPDGNELVLNTKPVVPALNGTVVITSNGNYTYTPKTGFIGEDYFTYSVCEKNTTPSLCSEATVTIEVREQIPGNKAPIANEDETVVLSGKQVIIHVLANDFDPDSNPIHISRIPTSVSHGTLVQNADGTFTYTPTAGYSGTDQFVYEICDNQVPSLCARATVSIQVNAPLQVNNPPFAADDAFFTTGAKISGNMALNDLDPDGNKLVYEITPVVDPTKGTVTISANGLFEYSPDASFDGGSDQFVYQVCDDGTPAACSKATVYITMLRNKKPVLVDDQATTTVNKAVSGNLLANDSDPDGNQLILKLIPVSGLANGTIVLKADGSFTYTPKSGFSGQDEITYEVCDDGNPPACAQAKLVITVEKEVPVVVDRLSTNDVNITFKNIPVSGNVLINDAGFYGFNSFVTMFLDPVHGTVIMDPNGQYTYKPANEYVGIDNFYYKVCTAEDPADCDTVNVTIQVLTDVLSQIPPVANDDEKQTLLNTAVSGNVLANDLSVSGEQIILNTKPLDGPKSGTLVLNDNGSYIYTPKTGFIGTDYFVYEIYGAVSGLTAIARVTITVSNDPEVRLFASDDIFFSYGKLVQGNLLANDSYPSVSTLVVTKNPVVMPVNGTVTINSNGTFSYTPTVGFVGTDQFVYQICDSKLNECDNATVFIVVKEAPALFADLKILKTGPEFAIPGEAVNYELTVTNLGTAAASQIQINDYLPAAIQNPKYNISGSTIIKDWNGYYVLGTLAVNQTFSLFISGTVSLNAPDTLKNMATVSSLTWDPKTDNNISVVKTLVHRGPVARILGAPALIVASCNTQGQVLDASKSGGDGLSFSWSPSTYLDNPSSAKPIFHTGKTTRYHLTVTDSKGLKDTTSVLVSVLVAPMVLTERNVFVDAPNTTILLNASKSIGAGLTYLWLSKGGIILSGETTPTAQVSGLGMYYVQVTDRMGCINTDSVNVGLYIQAINDTAKTIVNQSVIINVLRNDTPPGKIIPSSISIVTPPLHGIAEVSADSLILYWPEYLYVGQDEFVYAICDYFNNCDNAKVLVLISDIPFFIPQAFSPNGDGINDFFEIKGLSKYKNVEIEIINRWGNIVYQSKNYGEGEGKDGFWNGRASSGLRTGSGPVPSGTYYYILKMNGAQNIQGSIYLDR
ncbi:MAG: Ig-like domain-containing protein [Bacteroidota bacterium]|nr:Ig-like domain-containing protein [Bacteroidota bacterium]